MRTRLVLLRLLVGLGAGLGGDGLGGGLRRAQALEPREVLVVANEAMPESVALAEEYLKRRVVPAENLLRLRLPTGEVMPRAIYDEILAPAVRRRVQDSAGKLRCVLCVYGVPLKIGRQLATAEEAAAWAPQAEQRHKLREQLAQLERQTPRDNAAIEALREQIRPLDQADYKLNHHETEAATDSELMLVLQAPYELYRIQPNPLYAFFPSEKRQVLAPKTLYTARLDGPTVAIARRLLDDALAVEAAGGLSGRIYIDARGLKYDPQKPNQATGYEGYDESFREAAALLKDAGLDVVLEDTEALFPPQSGTRTALYAGWYAANRFIPSHEFVRGAVAWHLASFELASLREPGTQWGPNLLRAGAAATIGPVHEPYTIAFPKPAEFLPRLLCGQCLVEAYAESLYVASWMNTLVGDPLYRPFPGPARLDRAKIVPSPRGMPAVFR